MIIESRLFNIKQEEVRLYRIMDITLKKSFIQRIFGVGTIHFCTADKSTPDFDIASIKNPNKIKDIISDMVEEERSKKMIHGREYMFGNMDDNTH